MSGGGLIMSTRNDASKNLGRASSEGPEYLIIRGVNNVENNCPACAEPK